MCSFVNNNNNNNNSITDVSGAVFECNDVLMSGQSYNDIRRQVNSRVGWHTVQYHWHTTSLSHLHTFITIKLSHAMMAIQALMRRTCK